jgi:hypothetical protein
MELESLLLSQMDETREDTDAHQMLDSADTGVRQPPPQGMISNITIDNNTDLHAPATILELEARSTPLPVTFAATSITNPSSMASLPTAQKVDGVSTGPHRTPTPMTPPPPPKVVQDQSRPSSRPTIVHIEEDDDDDEGIPEINMESDSD